MPPKRQTSSPKSPRRKRNAASSPSPIVTTDEKRKLILAHAAMRGANDPQQAFSVWAGALAAFAVILVGWWWLAKPAYTQLLAQPSDPGVQEMKQAAISFGEKTRQDLDEAAQRLSELGSQADREQRTLDLMAEFATRSATSTIFTTTSSTHATTTYAQ